MLYMKIFLNSTLINKKNKKIIDDNRIIRSSSCSSFRNLPHPYGARILHDREPSSILPSPRGYVSRIRTQGRTKSVSKILS